MSRMEYVVAEEMYDTYGKKPEQSVVLKQGMPLITKYPHTYGNAVVYQVLGDNTSKRNPVRVLTDYGNLMIFPSVEDVLFYWNVCPKYKYSPESGYCLKKRLDKQLELITNAIKELE